MVLKPFFSQTVQSSTLLINVVVLVFANKLIMTKLVGNWDSLFPMERFRCYVAFFPRTMDSSCVKICILIAHYYPSLHWGFAKSTLILQKFSHSQKQNITTLIGVHVNTNTVRLCFQLRVRILYGNYFDV